LLIENRRAGTEAFQSTINNQQSKINNQQFSLVSELWKLQNLETGSSRP